MLKVRTMWEECRVRLKKANIGYLSYACLCLFLGGVGVWSPLAFPISTEQQSSHLFALLTFGFAITGGMLLDVILAHDRSRELTVVGVLIVVIGLVLLLNQFFKAGPYPTLTYLGVVLVIGVWFLANVESYEGRVKASATSAIGGDIESEIQGGGLNSDE